jgi:hypothetical protein
MFVDMPTKKNFKNSRVEYSIFWTDDKLFRNSRGLFVLEALVKVLTLRSVQNKSDGDETGNKRSHKVHSVINFNLKN